jgi:D-alanine-D-alanine ligase-like ATP-grasp enzyme
MSDLPQGARPFLRLLEEAATSLGGRVEVDPAFGHIGRYIASNGRVWPFFGNALGLNSDASAALAADKTYCAQILGAAGLAVPAGCLVVSDRYRAALSLKNARVAAGLPGVDVGLEFAAAQGMPVFVKPNRGSEGQGVSCATDIQILQNDLAALLAHTDHVRIERAVSGRDYRLVVLDAQVVAAYERRPFSAVGDGRHGLGELLQTALTRLEVTHRGAKLAADDPRIARALEAQNLRFDDIPENGQVVWLLANANLSTGGELVDVFDVLPVGAAQLACAASAALGLRFAGVDLIAPDLQRDPSAAVVLEVNSAPGLDFYAALGPANWARARGILRSALATLA